MKILYESKEMFTEMATLSQKRADKKLCGDFGKFIYFSRSNSGHSMRIKFDGGKSETDTTDTAPTLKFDKSGECELELQPWMNRQNCPNAFDKKSLQKVIEFVRKFLAILLLTWFKKFDESDVIAFFEGRDTFEELLTNIENIDDRIKNLIIECKNCEELHDFCLEYNLYEF